MHNVYAIDTIAIDRAIIVFIKENGSEQIKQVKI